MFSSVKCADFHCIVRLRYSDKCGNMFGKKSNKDTNGFSLLKIIFSSICTKSVYSELPLSCQKRWRVSTAQCPVCHYYWNRRRVRAWPWHVGEHCPFYIRAQGCHWYYARGGVPHPESQDRVWLAESPGEVPEGQQSHLVSGFPAARLEGRIPYWGPSIGWQTCPELLLQ